MKITKKILVFGIVFILFGHKAENIVCAEQSPEIQNQINVGVFLYNSKDPFLSNVIKSLEDLENDNKNNVKFTIFDAKGNQGIQNENISQALNENFNLFVVNPVSIKEEEVENILIPILKQNIPLIVYLPSNMSIRDFISKYSNAIIIGGDIDQSGLLEGKILADTWNSNKDVLDKNKDNILQYVLLEGPANNEATISRDKYTIQALNDAGIKTERLSSSVCNWDQECAQVVMESKLLVLNNKIEAVIANNDAMAIGAINALQKYGFNKGDNSKTIPVVGIDGLPKALELIEQGIMTGTAAQDFTEQANAIYTVGKNLIYNDKPLKGTNYKTDITGTKIELPYYEVIKN